MYKTLLVCVLILAVLHVNTTDICDVCTCRYDTRSYQDSRGEEIDCSYQPTILNMEYNLPPTTIKLDLSLNNLTIIKNSSVLQSSVTELYLNNNDITEITNNAFKLPELKILDLSHNNLQVIHEDIFLNIKKLEYINLANNKFTTFTKLSFHHLSNLNEIILDNNNLGHTLKDIDIFDRNGYGLTHKIKSISISGINMNNVPDNFFIDTYDIKKIVISNNNLTEIFKIPYTLQYLDISDNPINQIFVEDFIDLPGLKTLKLNNLDINEIPEYVFSSLHTLTHLELDRNMNLTDFSPLAFGREVLDDPDDFLLETLSLRGSRLQTLDERLLEPFGQLVSLDLQGNPWQCDCNLVWLKKLQIPAEDYEYLRCATPKNLYNSKIFDLDTQYFTCRLQRHLKGFTIAIVSLCVLLSLTAMWMFVCLPARNRWNFAHQLYPTAAYSILPVNRAEI